jgi:hypothetical protein
LEKRLEEETAFNGESIILEYSERPEMLDPEIFARYKDAK